MNPLWWNILYFLTPVFVGIIMVAGAFPPRDGDDK